MIVIKFAGCCSANVAISRHGGIIVGMILVFAQLLTFVSILHDDIVFQPYLHLRVGVRCVCVS